jgi:hypothetical protein
MSNRIRDCLSNGVSPRHPLIYADRVIVNKFSVPSSGGAAEMGERPFSGITLKSVSANIRDLTYMVGGKEVSSQHAFVSGDGRTMCLVTRGVNQQGAMNETTAVFVKR